MLEVSNLEVVYNDVVLVLRGISLEAAEGSIVALLGANGAGKTTTARAITGLLDVHEGDITKGSVRFEGKGHYQHPALGASAHGNQPGYGGASHLRGVDGR